MAERILYVYAEPREVFPRENYNMTALVVNGKVVDTSAGLNAERIEREVTSAYANNVVIKLNRHPNGMLMAKLDTDLETVLKVIIGVK